MLRCHRRTKTLSTVLNELRRIQECGLAQVRIHAAADRPTDQVRTILANHNDLIRTTWEPDFQVVGPKGEKFREFKKAQFEQIKNWSVRPDWILFQDDDRWFEPNRITEELPKVLADKDHDMWLAESLFIWDRSDQYNANRLHRSPVLFRFRPRDQYPLDRDIQAPSPLHDQAIIRRRAGVLKTPLLDYGTFSEGERARVYAAFMQAGKDDPYVHSIVEEPELLPVSNYFNIRGLGTAWKDLWR